MKYTIVEVKTGVGVEPVGIFNNEIKELIAICTGKNKETNAQKICGLLNETSRSQGKYK